MIDSTPDWLNEEADHLYTAGCPPLSTVDRARAAGLGRRAAADTASLPALVDALLAAAARHWATAPGEHGHPSAAGTEFLHAVRALTGEAMRGYHEHTRSELSRSDVERAEFVDDLLSGRADPGRLAQRAHRYGIRLSGIHTVVVARGNAIDEAAVNHVDEALATRYGAGNTLTTLRGSKLVCVSTGGLRGLPAELALLHQIGPSGWQIAVGRPHPGLLGIATSLDEAVNALDLATKLGFTSPVLNAADLLVFPVLLRDREAITDLVGTVLGPLTTARGGPRPFLDTLTALFDNQGNHTAAARHLHLSVRAVTYRLDRIQALTGYHPGEPTQRFTLQAAVLGARLLGWPPG
jgi:sugar diacid utilization regulator